MCPFPFSILASKAKSAKYRYIAGKGERSKHTENVVLSPACYPFLLLRLPFGHRNRRFQLSSQQPVNRRESNACHRNRVAPTKSRLISDKTIEKGHKKVFGSLNSVNNCCHRKSFHLIKNYLRKMAK